jgi:hypothetical protein
MKLFNTDEIFVYPAAIKMQKIVYGGIHAETLKIIPPQHIKDLTKDTVQFILHIPYDPITDTTPWTEKKSP